MYNLNSFANNGNYLGETDNTSRFERSFLEDEVCFINDKLQEAIKSAEKTKILYINLVAKT